jgi:hypothetical protein
MQEEISYTYQYCVGLCRTPEEAIAAVEKQAEVVPHIQDDFDIVPGELAVLDIAERPENQVRREASLIS